ncbi:MAG: phosphoribosylformylglycinamidine cyclo-ligase [Bacteroidales bacterium]|jgi:phosphoribosylaminoimidazole (AIR) synthetase|nr:phosphoribosylformylglycinamidine cyclo-ligase [Bacteroidales bacterium]
MESTTKNEQCGVSASKNDVRNAGQDKGLFPKAFCKIVPDVFGDFAKFLFSKPTVNVMHTNGVGSKSILAHHHWKETGDFNVWKNLAQDAVVMNLDDLICSGITTNILLSSTINRNQNHIPEEVINTIVSGMEAYLEELRSQHINIRFGGEKVTNVGDLVQSVTVDTTTAVRIRQGEIIANDRIQDKDVIIGLASHEQHLLSPLQTYLPVIKAILENFRPSIHGLVHCSDGGQTKCLNFVNDLHIVKDHLFTIPSVFSMIQSESNMSWKEMYKTFNMGHRFEVFTKEKIASDIIKITQYFNIDAQIIGHCETAPNKALTIKSEYGTFQY